MQEQKNVALVTGSSSGIGFETSLLLASTGFHTYASMRNLEKSKNITEIANTEKLPLQVVQLDVNDGRSVKDAIDKIVAEKDRIDILVNNAGYGLFGSLEDISIEEVKAQFETNFFGVIRVTQQVLPVMRKQNSRCTIVNVSSVGGRIGFPILSAYQSTKFALEGLSESMSYELEPFGIRVVIIEPGFIRTNIINSSTSAKKALDPKSPYFSLMQKVENHFKSMMENASSPPEEVARVILKALTSENPQLRYTVGNDAATIVQARMNMPDKEFRKMVIQNFSS
jgi:NAD(P)-dependent dehydrogenase (short-subunit alcohol dehydrogenase family)